MKLKLLATLTVTLFLGACSSVPEHTFNTDFQEPSCCVTLNALPLTSLSLPFHQQMVMDASLPSLSSAVLFPSYKGAAQPLPVMSYQITSKDPISLLVRSYVNNDALFAVNVLVYDQHWQPLSEYSADDFTYHTTGMRGHERIENLMTINPQLNGAKYLIITADPTQLGTELSRTPQEKVYAESQHVIGNKQLPLTAKFQPFGVIDITASASHNNAILTLLNELSAQTREGSATETTRAASPQAQDQWELYQSQIDSALKAQDFKQAAKIANQAAQQGFTQAKDYLVKQLAK